MQLPRCREKEMKLSMETIKFLEMNCDICKDVVYVKKEKTIRPQMLDD